MLKYKPNNKHLYELTGGEQPISVSIRKRQLQFVGHCLRMATDEPANIYALYTSRMAKSRRRGTGRSQYIDQISEYLCSNRQAKLTAEEIAKIAVDKKTWFKVVAAPHQPD